MSEERFDRLEKRLDTVSQDISDLTKIVVGIKDYMVDNMVTREELAGEINSLDTRLSSKIEGAEERLNGNIARVKS